MGWKVVGGKMCSSLLYFNSNKSITPYNMVHILRLFLDSIYSIQLILFFVHDERVWQTRKSALLDTYLSPVNYSR